MSQAPQQRPTPASGAPLPPAEPADRPAEPRRPPAPTLEAVDSAVARLADLDDAAFSGSISDHLWWMTSATTPEGEPVHPLTEEDVADQAAYRTPALAMRSLKAVRRAQQTVRETVPRQEGETDASWNWRVLRYQGAIEREETLLETVVAGLKAQRGILATPRNPRRRAEHRLAQLNLAEDVPRGTITDLVRQEKLAAKRRR